jgi:hypothetical protein
MNPKAETRTDRQNRAIHKYLEMVAHELSNQGQTMNGVVAKMTTTESPPTKNSVKEVIWKPIQTILCGKKSTTELSTAEVNKVYEVVSQFLANQFQISLPFPTYEDIIYGQDSTKTENS